MQPEQIQTLRNLMEAYNEYAATKSDIPMFTDSQADDFCLWLAKQTDRGKELTENINSYHLNINLLYKSIKEFQTELNILAGVENES